MHKIIHQAHKPHASNITEELVQKLAENISEKTQVTHAIMVIKAVTTLLLPIATYLDHAVTGIQRCLLQF